jgi:acyl-coenzyme A synthetase/AMP-(fatty) acid ligase
MNTRIARIPDESWIEGAPASIDPCSGRPFEPLSERDLIRQALGPLDEIVASHPDAVAVDDGFKRLTYGELWRAAQSLAAAIRDVGAPDRIVLAPVRSDVFFPVMLIGAYLAGRPCVFLDAASPIDRQTAILDSIAAATGVVLVAAGGDRYLSRVSEDVPRLPVVLDPPGPLVVVRRSVGPDEFGAVFFSSGSTGRPKGIAATSRATTKYVTDAINLYRIGPGDVVVVMGWSTHVGTRDALASLLSGARLRLFDLKRAGLREAFRMLREDQVTILNLVPSVLRTMAQLQGAEQAFETLRVVVIAGEAINGNDVALFRSKLPAKCKISFALGSVETARLFHWFVPEEALTGSRVPVGFLVAGRRICLIDDDGNPTPRGEVGELVVSDDYIALGDWKENRIDSSRFETDPATGKRVYATGDLLRMRPDGLYEFAGRRDRMVKVLGLRADLGEIEAMLMSMEGVADAAVVAHAREAEHTTLIGFVVTSPGSPITHAEMRRRIAVGAAPHMAPSAIHRIDEIPRLHNGKPDLMRLKSLAETYERQRLQG